MPSPRAAGCVGLKRQRLNAENDEGPMLSKLLEMTTEEERLGDDEKWYCPKCKAHVNAHQRRDFYDLPDVLVKRNALSA